MPACGAVGSEPSGINIESSDDIKTLTRPKIQGRCLFLKIRRHAVLAHLDVYRSADHPVVYYETLHCHPEIRFISLTCRVVKGTSHGEKVY